MIESTSFGSLSLAGGTPRLTGTSSKLDTEALVRAAYEAKRLPAVRLEQRAERNDSKLAAYDTMRGLLDDLNAAVNGLRNPPGLNGASSNLFEQKDVFLTTSDGAPASQKLGVIAAPQARPARISVEILQVAQAHKLASTGAASADTTLADAWNGGAAFTDTLTIGIGGDTPAAIAIDGTMTLAELELELDAVDGLDATMLKVGTNEFRLVLAADETGQALAITDGGSGIAAALTTDELQAARPASLLVDGIAVERSSNRIDDLLTGVTLDLYRAEPGVTIDVEIAASLGSAKEAVTTFVAAYNAFREFVEANNRIDATGAVDAEAVLFGDQTLRTVTRELAALVGGAATGIADGRPATLRDLGVTLTEGNRLEIDEGKLDAALLNDLDGARGVFEFGFHADSPDLRVFARTNALTDTAFDVVVTDADGDGVPEAVTFDGVAGTVSGNRLIGAEGSAFEGLELLWTGTGNAQIGVTVSAGIADRVFNRLDRVLDPISGDLGRAAEALGAQNERFARDIARIEERALTEQTRLSERLAAMEAALSLAETLISQIRAQMDAATANQ